MNDDYYKRISNFNIINKPEWYKLLVRNTAGGLLGLISGGMVGLINKFTGTYENINMFVHSGLMTGVYDGIMLISTSKIRRREAMITGKTKLRLILEDNPGFFAGNALGYYLTSFIPGN